MEGLIFAGDIGATKAELALFAPGKGGLLSPKRQANLKSTDYDSLQALLIDFLRQGPSNEKCSSGCLAIAGVVLDDTIITPNLVWGEVSVAAVRREIGVETLHFINDLHAMAYGVPTQLKTSLLELNAGKQRQGNRAVLAAGTGLGEALLIDTGSGWLPSPSEGGHTDFAPRDSEQEELRRFLSNEFGHVSYERLLSGPGLFNIYRFMRQRDEGEPDWLAQSLKHNDPAQVISEAALSRKSALCERAVDMFISIYGAEAGNLALKGLALGGVYLSGGVTLRLLTQFKNETFMKAFSDKGRYAPLLRDIPVKVLLNPRIALEGAMNHLLQRFSSTSGSPVRPA